MALRPALTSLRRATTCLAARRPAATTTPSAPAAAAAAAASRRPFVSLGPPRLARPAATTTTTTTTSAPPAARRAFSATPRAATKTIKPHRLPWGLIPPYPYGERRVYKQSNKGLYGSARIRFGNVVAPKHGNKTRRRWRPNVHVKAFYSPALGARVKTRLTLRVLKTVRREGGIDEYLLKSKPARIKELGPGGWNLRWLLMQTRAVQLRFNRERVALGLEPVEVEDRDDMIRYALDFATPGPLSAASRDTLADIRAAAAAGFALGHEPLENLDDDIRELSDEAEAELLRQPDEADQPREAPSADADKGRVEA